jgi:hypothetical protein
MEAPVAVPEFTRLIPVTRINRHANTPVNDEGLCERCASIPWEKLATTSESADDLIFPVHEPLLELKLSRCRICRLFAHTVLTHVNGFYPGPLNLRLCAEDIFHNSRCRGLFFDNGTSRSSELESEHPRFPHLIITDLGARQAQADLDYLFPGSIDMNQLRSWLAECNAMHDSSCRPLYTGALQGFKVINCAQRTIELAPPGCQYIALSYVWGPQAASSRLPQDEDLRQMLPQTIEDSIIVTQALGFRYLWVDRYVRAALVLSVIRDLHYQCIDQGDSTEKDVQISHMGEIYAAAQLTIVAATGPNSDYGLPGVQPFTRGVEFTGEHITPIHLFVYPGEAAAREIFSTPWVQRAW